MDAFLNSNDGNGSEFDLNEWINDSESVRTFTVPPLSSESLEDLNALQASLAISEESTTSNSGVEMVRMLSSGGLNSDSRTSLSWYGGNSFRVSSPESLSVQGNNTASSSSNNHNSGPRPTIPTVPKSSSVTLSSVFLPKPENVSWPSPDIVLISIDMMVFYVNQHFLLHSSTNSFAGLLPILTEEKRKRVRRLPDTAAELNIILHAFYSIPSAKFTVPFPTLIKAVDRLPVYGFSPKTRITPSTALYSALLSQGALYPLEFYTLAAHHDMQELATTISSHLLSLSLRTINEETAERMGPVYLMRLFKLHQGRTALLMQSLMPPPLMHNESTTCSFEDQKELTSAWTSAAAYLSWLAKPDTSSVTIRAAFNSMTEHIICPDCQRMKNERVDELVGQWSIAPRTISF